MQWIIDNWLTLVLVGGMLAMHLFGHGHGGHGGHGGHSGHDGCGPGRKKKSTAPDTRDAGKDNQRAG